MTDAPSKLSEHLANINAIIVELGEDAAALERRFAGDVEGHLRVAESHLMEIINAVKPTTAPEEPTVEDEGAEDVEPAATEPEPADAVEAVPAAASSRRRR